MAIPKWETVPSDGENLERLKVHGGWLVKTYSDVMHRNDDYGDRMQSGWDWRVAMTFVPDPNHEWELEGE